MSRRCSWQPTDTGELFFIVPATIASGNLNRDQTTLALRQLLANGANDDELVAYLRDRFLPADETEAYQIAADLLKAPPEQG
jgi:hypothetical protein